ncbi:hypothetical protein D4R08_06650 [Corynebacterium xerosis]|nr:hypothetical protein D4R08_06650 [Corynebacterium xerosis]
MAKAHGRKVETLSLIQSFQSTEFDPTDPDDIQAVNGLGYELAKRLYPDCDALVITHTDSAGGHPHNHIKVINHDKTTGKVPTRTMHWQVAKENDALMREHHLSVVKRGNRQGQAPWELKRDGAAVTEFEQRLGDTIEEILADEKTTSTEIFKSALAERGIELIEKKHVIKAAADGSTPEHESIGWTYKMRDELGPKPRMRRRKASVMSEEFTHDGAHEIFEWNKQRQAATAAAPAPVPQTIREEEYDDEREGSNRTAGSGEGRRGAESGDQRVGALVPRVDRGGEAGARRVDRAADRSADQDEGTGRGNLAAVREGFREEVGQRRREARAAAERDRRAREDGGDLRRSAGQQRSGDAGRRRDGAAQRPRRGFNRPAPGGADQGIEHEF